MLLAVDDTDSRNGMCTTFLLTEIIHRSGLDVIGYPRLVRLNPAIEFKTRGNGALAVNLGTGSGEPIKIGSLNSHDLISYPFSSLEPSPEELLRIGEQTVKELAELEEPNTNPGIVISSAYFPEEFYWKAVKEEISISYAEKFITGNRGRFVKIKNGRGIIGAAAALSWPGKNLTYEVLAYRNGKDRSPDASVKMRIAAQANKIQGTFNNIDTRNRYAAIFPKERTPVIMGIRGKSGREILETFPRLISGTQIVPDRYLCYETNQASDDHIIRDNGGLAERQSYILEGRVISKPEVIEGSHYFAFLSSNGRKIKMAAFEPTKEFRNIFRLLVPGDLIQVYGSYVNKTLNVEKMEVLEVSQVYSRILPFCDACGNKMESKGREDYRCPKCHSRKTTPGYKKVMRQINAGKYDVPVIARRHLSRPFELEMNSTGESIRVNY